MADAEAEAVAAAEVVAATEREAACAAVKALIQTAKSYGHMMTV